MKKPLHRLLLLAIVLLGVAYSLFKPSPNEENAQHAILPAPTNGQTIVKTGEEEGDNQEKREQWIESMHRAAPGTDWRYLEVQNARDKVARKKAKATPRGEQEVLANGQLIGYWNERGSLNQAGSVLATNYDQEEDKIYLISAGGSLWSGNRFNDGWEVLNQDFRFDALFFKLLYKKDGSRRILAAIGGIPHYSDDNGQSWTAASGISSLDNNAQSRDLLQVNDSTVYMSFKPTFFNRYRLYRSTDWGQSFERTDRLSSYENSRIKMIRPEGSDDLFLLWKDNERTTELFKVDQESGDLVLQGELPGIELTSAPANLCGYQGDTSLVFYIYDGDNAVHRSNDGGTSWNKVGELPERPWSVGLYILPSNPEVLLMGEVDCYKSLDGGQTWDLQNAWYEYYDFVESKLHADMMYFAEYQLEDGSPFILISNHGGLSVSYNEMDATDNIGLEGLNVGQFYDVVTDPLNPRYIYGGTQDQGFQRGFDNQPGEVIDMEQAISGDYGHLVFGKGGQTLWMTYPGGWITHYSDPQRDGYDAAWELDSDNESVWLPPLTPDPDPTKDIVYMAGGNYLGGTGSHIIKLEYNPNGYIEVDQLPYDFFPETQSTISAIKISPTNTDNWYVTTSNGRFFYSKDGGTTWEQTIDFVPSGHYLYGTSILPSIQDDSTVYLAGSGYSNPAVYKSTNGGESFVAMNTGMPPTLVFELAANEDESMLFAATEAGPYVYIAADDQWYDMSGTAAPTQTYWSVEYLGSEELIRFGTYGRGIWDFSTRELVSTPTVEKAAFQLFPNPAQNTVQLQLEEIPGKNAQIKLYDLNGRLLQSWDYETVSDGDKQARLSLSSFASGSYVLSIQDADKVQSKRLVIAK